MVKKYRINKLSNLIFLLLLLLITGCWSTTFNIKPTDNLDGKKILAGRLIVYNNDELVKGDTTSFKYTIFFNKDGDKEALALTPDEDGYIYVPVTTGRYNFGAIKICEEALIGPRFTSINFKEYPSVMVNDSDLGVNFGTINLKYYHSTSAKVIGFLVGVSPSSMKIEHIADYEVIRSPILTKIGKDITLTDGKVTFYGSSH